MTSGPFQDRRKGQKDEKNGRESGRQVPKTDFYALRDIYGKDRLTGKKATEENNLDLKKCKTVNTFRYILYTMISFYIYMILFNFYKVAITFYRVFVSPPP